MLRYLLELSSRNPVFHIDPIVGLQMANLVSLMLSKDLPISGEAFGMTKQAFADYSVAGQGGMSDMKKVRIISIYGFLTMHGGLCSHGLMDYENMLKTAANNADIDGLVLNIGSFGGEAMYNETIANTIYEVNKIKPVVAFGNQAATSAAYYLASPAEKIVSSGKSAIFGSIGTMIHYLDFTRKLKAEGIDEIQILASKSTDKNALNFSQPSDEDREKIIKNLLDPVNQVFLDDVEKYRPGMNAEVFTGKVYRGQAAIDIGLADQFGTIEDAIRLAAQLSDSSNSNSTKMNSSTTQEEKNSLIQEIKNLGNKVSQALNPKAKVTQVEDDPEKTPETQPDLAQLQAQLTEKDNLIASLKSQIEAKDKEIQAQSTLFEELKQEVETLGKKVNAPALPTQSAETSISQIGSKTEFVFSETAEAIKHWDEMGYEKK